MDRREMMNRVLSRKRPWDMIIVGGGATGAGIALDSASRGYEVLLLEQADFGKGTSSRSTKLVHGGVRYLEQGRIPLVIEALRERSILRQNAPHLVSDLSFVVPCYDWWEGPLYGMGLKIYDLLAGKHGFGSSRLLTREETAERLPTIRREGLRGGIVYHDGLFDDTRLLVNLLQTAGEQGATLLSYARVTDLSKRSDGLVTGIQARDLETSNDFSAAAKVVINATGPFSDEVRRMANPNTAPMITPSQGVHLVLDKSFVPGDSAIMVPHTEDGRIMFAIPWNGHTLVGTTDTAIPVASLEPRPLAEEIEFILQTAGHYLEKVPARTDVLSVFVGIRPLVGHSDGKDTATLSRDHTIRIESSGLVTIAGGKWTTYRRMAEDCVNEAASLARLPMAAPVTSQLRIHGFTNGVDNSARFAAYGSDSPGIENLIRGDPSLGDCLHPSLKYCGAEVVWATRWEMARTLEDVLARRTRALFLNARAACEMAPRTAAIMARELRQGETWQADQVRNFRELARGYMID
jgi:glycerol-3-phosphate dehydrogenase